MYGREQRVLLRHYLRQGLSKAEIARTLGVSRRTVYHWIQTGQLERELDNEAVRYTPRPPVQRNVDPFRQIILARLAEYPKLTATRLHDEIRAAGYAYRARTKGKVERPISYVRQSFFYGREFLNDADLNAQALSWVTQTANARVHRTTGERPMVRFERDERAQLKPFALQPYRSVIHQPTPTPRPRLHALPSVERRPLAVYSQLVGARS